MKLTALVAATQNSNNGGICRRRENHYLFDKEPADANASGATDGVTPGNATQHTQQQGWKQCL